jgi:hypothetical protein
MKKSLGILLLALVAPAVMTAHGTPAPPINPCAISVRCQPPGPSPCIRTAKKPCGVNPSPNGRHA